MTLKERITEDMKSALRAGEKERLGTIRLALLKIGALVRISVRRIHLAMASGCPWQNEFRLAHLRLTAAG